MRVDLKQMLMLTVLIGLVSGLAVSVSVKPVSDFPSSIAVAPNAEKIAISSMNGRVTVYDLSKDAPIVRSKRVGKGQGLFSFFYQGDIHFCDDDRIAVVAEGPMESEAAIWNMATGEVKKIEAAPGTAPSDISIDGHYLIRVNTATDSITLQDLAVDDGEIRELKNIPVDAAVTNPFGQQTAPIQISNDGQTMLVIEQDPNFGAGGFSSNYPISVIDVATGSKTASITVSLDYGQSPLLSPNGNFICIVDDSGRLTLYDKKFQEIGSKRISGFGNYPSQQPVCFSVDESRMAIQAYNKHEIAIYDTSDFSVVSRIDTRMGWKFFDFDSDTNRLFAFSSDGTSLYVMPGQTDSGMQIWDIQSGSRTRTVGRIYRFGPGCLFALGFCLWAAAWGLMTRSKLKKLIGPEAYSSDDVEFDADTISSSDLVEEDDDQNEESDAPRLPPVIKDLPPVRIGFDRLNFPSTPGAIKAVWVMMVIGGLWGIFYACIGAFYNSMSGMFDFEIVIFFVRMICNAFLLLTGVLALSRGVGRYTPKLYLTAAFQITTIVCCDFINFSLGLACLICCSTGVASHYVSRKHPRIGSLRN